MNRCVKQALLVVFTATILWDSNPASAQGPLRRLGDRIRSRIEPLVQPPAPTNPAPVPPAAAAPNVNPASPNAPRGPLNPALAPDISADTTRLRRIQPRPTSPLQPQPASPLAIPGLSGASVLEPATPRTSAPTALRPSASIGVEVAQEQGEVPGVRVLALQPFSEAAQAGLRDGDLILAVNGTPTPTISSVARQLMSLNVGDTVDIRVLPAEASRTPALGATSLSTRELRVPLVSRPATGAANNRRETVLRPPANTAPGNSAQASYEREPVHRTLGVMIESAPRYDGAIIRSVLPSSPASRANLTPGDRIVSIDGRVVRDAGAVWRIVGGSQPNATLRVQWVRDGKLEEAKIALGQASTTASDSVVSEGATSRQPSADLSEETYGRSILGDIGASIGNLLGTKSKPRDDEVANLESLPAPLPTPLPQPDTAMDELTPPERPLSNEIASGTEITSSKPLDPLAFGDDEPVGQASFNAEADSQSASRISSELTQTAPSQSARMPEPPSIDKATPPILDGPSSDPAAKTDQTIQLLRSEIERLRMRIRQLETADTNL